MVDYIEELLRDLGQDLRRRYHSFPSKSVEYTIMMQDLSRGKVGSTVPNIEFSNPDMRAVYHALCEAPKDLQEFFMVYYFKRWGRDRKIKELGVKNKDAMYKQRDFLLAYISGRLSTKIMSRQSP